MDGKGNEKFEKSWRDLVESQNRQILDYVEDKIKANEMESNQSRNQTLQTVRRQSADFENEKCRFNENITKINQEPYNGIEEFRSRLATATQ